MPKRVKKERVYRTMRDAPVPIIRTPETGPGREGYRDEHPSYGTIAISHVQHGGGGTVLFQSRVRTSNTISLTIRRADRVHSLSQDWVHGGEEIVEVEMTAAQFAAFITTPNSGTGMPCTIRYTETDGQIKDPLDPDSTEIERIRDHFDEHTRGLRKKLDKLVDEVTELLAGNMNKGTKERIRSLVIQIQNDVGSNVPFIAEQLQRSADKTVAAAKTEIETFLTTAIYNRGLEALQGDIQVRGLLGDESEIIEGGNTQ